MERCRVRCSGGVGAVTEAYLVVKGVSVSFCSTCIYVKCVVGVVGQ